MELLKRSREDTGKFLARELSFDRFRANLCQEKFEIYQKGVPLWKPTRTKTKKSFISFFIYSKFNIFAK
jgi:hypothetical protein